MGDEKLQPPLFEIKETPPDENSFINEKGKKKKSIPTGMTRQELNELARRKAPRGPAPIGADDWAKK
ncbi:MAG TPA: hypothetical protein VN174_03095 [Candidatus Methanoperedens sp.]|nr:hypothetical protein [Candidatus Methanoperedens sp.]